MWALIFVTVRNCWPQRPYHSVAGPDDEESGEFYQFNPRVCREGRPKNTCETQSSALSDVSDNGTLEGRAAVKRNHVIGLLISLNL
ncbi:jg27170 [Pararge aegeria aegeria]|uniref:Jg27170 protein n=1 Tax=Pararge aegeria aegeria TaxID=348720 RepID=A0A8S4SHA6_9NEOP|nr:jg27170 [Pararge aegeria aegeria]